MVEDSLGLAAKREGFVFAEDNELGIPVAYRESQIFEILSLFNGYFA